MPNLGTLLSDLAVLAGLMGLGVVVCRITLGRAGALAVGSIAFPLGSGIFTWLLFVLSWAGLPLTALTVGVVFLFLVTFLMWLRRRRTLPLVAHEDAMRKESGERLPRLALVVLLAVFLAILAPLAVGRAHSRWDGAAGWIIKGYGIALEGDIRAGETWGAWGLAYPLNIPLQATLFRLFSGDRLPGSMLVFPIFAASLMAGVYRFWSRHGVPGWTGVLGIALLLTNPLLLLHSTIAYANLPTAAYVVLGTCWLLEGLEEERRTAIVTGALLFGLAGWTRPEALLYGLLVMPIALCLYRISRKKWIMPGSMVLPFAVLVGVWVVFGWSDVERSHLGSAMNGLLPRLREGEFRLFELYLIPRLLSKRAFDPPTWGYLLPIAGALCLLGLLRQLRRPDALPALSTLLSAAVISLVPIGVFYVRSFTRQSDFIALLNRSFDRAFLPAAVMLLVLGFLLTFGRAASGPSLSIQNMPREPAGRVDDETVPGQVG